MAVSKTVLAANEPKIGIKAETSYGVALDSTGNDGTAYRRLPVAQAVKPKWDTARTSRLLSDRGLVKNAADSYQTDKGGTVTAPFEFWATPKLLAQFLAAVGQQHSESGTYVHTTSFDDSGMINEIGGTITNNIPHTFNLAYYPGAGEGIKVVGTMVSDLGLSLTAGSNSNLLTMSGNFFSGHSGTSVSTASVLEQTFDGTWVAPETTYYSLNNIQTKTLDVDDGTAQDFILKSISFNIANGANRIGSDVNGDAENIVIPEYTITGNMAIKYDANFDYGATRNVLQDFLDGDTLSLSLQWGDGTVSSAGEMNIAAELQYTGDPGQDIGESGIFHTLEFECLVNGSTPALKFQIFNGESQTSW